MPPTPRFQAGFFEEIPNAGSHFGVRPINHASLALSWDVNVLSNVVVYVDPVGDAKLYAQTPKPQLILFTHTHPDHLSADTLKAVASDKTVLVAPASVAAQLPAEFKSRTTILTNGQSATVCDLLIEAIPMYKHDVRTRPVSPQGTGQRLRPVQERGPARLRERRHGGHSRNARSQEH